MPVKPTPPTRRCFIPGIAGVGASLLVGLACPVATAEPEVPPSNPPSESPPATPEAQTTAEPQSPAPASPEPPVPDGSDTLAPGDSPPPEPGDDVAIVFSAGSRTEGVLVSSEPGLYIVRIGGLDVQLRPSDITSITRLPPVEERFAQMRGLVTPGDVKALLALSAWAEARGLLTRALGVVEEALDVEPQNGDALRAKAVLERQIELKQARRVESSDPDADALAEDENSPAIRELVIRDFPFLTEQQINLMKVMEVDLKNPPRMVIQPATIEALLRGYPDHPAMPVTKAEREAFKRRPPAEILDMMFRVGARELYSQVEVIGNPESMRAFRDRVHGAWVMNSMATTRCHGGKEGGRLLLANRKAGSNETLYTNFLILERFRTRDGDPLIDYAQPERSVLLEMGLPREEAIFPHPEVLGWRPVFFSRDDRAYQRAVEWIRMMYQPRPAYPIEYTPPGMAGERPEDSGSAGTAKPVVR